MRKISEMNTEELAVCLCNAADPVSNLLGDNEVVDAFGKLGEKMKGKRVLAMFGMFVSVVVPTLLGEKHRDDTYALLAAVSGVSVDEVKRQNGFKTAKDVWAIFMTDVDMASMFRDGDEARAE